MPPTLTVLIILLEFAGVIILCLLINRYAPRLKEPASNVQDYPGSGHELKSEYPYTKTNI